MSGAAPPFPLYAFMAWTRTTLPFVVYLDSVSATEVCQIRNSATRDDAAFDRKKYRGLNSSTGVSKFDIVLMRSFQTFLLPNFVFK
jgi:hypothetical protein